MTLTTSDLKGTQPSPTGTNSLTFLREVELVHRLSSTESMFSKAWLAPHNGRAAWGNPLQHNCWHPRSLHARRESLRQLAYRVPPT